MSSYRWGVVAFGTLGLWFAASGILGLPTLGMMVWWRREGRFDLEQLVLSGSATLLTIGAGALLLRFRHALAHRLFDDHEPDVEPSRMVDLQTVAFAAVGVLLIISTCSSSARLALPMVFYGPDGGADSPDLIHDLFTVTASVALTWKARWLAQLWWPTEVPTEEAAKP